MWPGGAGKEDISGMSRPWKFLLVFWVFWWGLDLSKLRSKIGYTPWDATRGGSCWGFQTASSWFHVRA